MIKNDAPVALVIDSATVGYTSALLYHSGYNDPDTVGKAFWAIQGSSETFNNIPDITKFYVILRNLPSGTSSVRGAYYDSMVDEELLQAKLQINLSEPYQITTKQPPKITNVEAEYTTVEIGAGQRYLNIHTTGNGEYIEIEAIPEAGGSPIQIYTGEQAPVIVANGIESGKYTFRVRGTIFFPSGQDSDVSSWSTSKVFDIAYKTTPPTAPSNLGFVAAQIKDGVTRYDVKLTWDWNRGSGPAIRDFVVYYVTKAEYDKTKWATASVINTGATQQAVLVNFPWGVPSVFKVVATTWGTAGSNITESSVTNFTLNESTKIDNTFANETGIDITNYHILGRLLRDKKWVQTFRIDAKTGAVQLGELDANGIAPVTVNPNTGQTNINGKVITEDIYAANFILTNLDGKTNPALKTQGKSYGSPIPGIFMSVDNAGKPKVDIGDKDKYIRYDGNELSISGNVKIGNPANGLTLEEGLKGKLTVFIYKVDTNKPTTPTSKDYPPSGWSKTPPSISDPFTQKIWVSTGTLDPFTNKIADGENYSNPSQWSGTSANQVGLNLFTGTAGISAEAKNASAVRVGVPLGDRDISVETLNLNRGKPMVMSCMIDTNGITSGGGANRIGMEMAITYTDGTTGYWGCWYSSATAFSGVRHQVYTIPTNKTVARASTGLYIQGTTTFSRVSKPKVEEGSIPTAWVDAGVDGKPGEPGKSGANGQRGPGFYSQPRSNGSWSDADATAFFRNNFGGAPVKYDVLTQFQSNNPANATTRQWNGSAWAAAALLVHGNMIVDGSITAKKMIADSAFFANAGIDVIYNRDAALSSNPEANYKMKIDLKNSEIHIR
ncbi:straight fiber tail protein [Proteus phage vB_PMC-PL1]